MKTSMCATLRGLYTPRCAIILHAFRMKQQHYIIKYAKVAQLTYGGDVVKKLVKLFAQFGWFFAAWTHIIKHSVADFGLTNARSIKYQTLYTSRNR